MAGGKETPRQKMVGMMYLVLTALLALNVSKSILDAFVAIEENTQKSAIVQLDRGNAFVGDLKQGIEQNQKEAPLKAAKCKYYLGVIEKLDKRTGDIIEFIDKMKLNILEKSGENILVEKKDDKETILWKKYDKKDPLRPARMNLMAVQAKDQYDVPMHEIIGEEINNPDPSKDGMKLWKMYNDYRAFIVESVGTIHDKIDSVSGTGIGNPLHTVKTLPINNFKDNADLDKQVTAMLNKSNVFNKNNGNIKAHEDFGLLKQLYMELTKQERFEEINDVKNVHWIGKTFDHSPLVAALASLTAMQLEILNARATATGALASKVVVAELSFNKLIALASASPSVVDANGQVDISVVMGAYDTDNQPEVKGGSFKVENGMGKMTTTVGSDDQTFSGTIAIKSRTGAVKELPWEVKVGVIKSEGTAAIVCEDLKVVYVGIPMSFKCGATGMYKNVSCSPSTVTATAGQKTVTVSASGTDLKGNRVSLGSMTYVVKPCPKPELYWNGTADGNRGNKNGGSLTCAFGTNVPFSPDKGKFSVISYTISISGVKGSLEGSGSSISPAHLNILKSAPPGKCSISVKYSGTAQGRVTAMYDI